jgi:cysteine-rich repeat protein
MRTSAGPRLGLLLIMAFGPSLWLAAAPLGASARELLPRIANGVPTTDQPTTGALLVGSSGFQACSGTLIGCRTFLTAAHCVCNENGSTCNPSESSYQVFLQHEGLFQVSQITPNPSYVDGSLQNDIAVVTLSAFADGISPTPMASTAPAFGSSGTIAGFGTLNDAPQMGSGIKREGAIVTANCNLIGGSNSQLVCWDFGPPLGPPGTDSNTCPGDSGGPLFTSSGGQTVISGVTSFGTGPCAGDDFSGDTNVATHAGWVASVAGSDVTETSCGALPQVGDADVQVTGFDGFLAGTSSEAVHSFSVPPGTLELRVTLNGQDDGPENFDLQVRFGAPPSSGLNDCESATSSQFEACALVAPTPGTWYALARSAASSGAYQLTASSFGGSAICGDASIDPPETCDDGNTLPGDGCDEFCQIEPVCGNGAVEPGETCDDGNLVSGDGCSDTCQLEPPVCGNGVTQPGETCDDGNTLPGDGCDELCRIEPGCGNGVVESPEACDDGNTLPGDGCDELCQIEPACGDGVVGSPETCDDGNTLPGDGCDELCRIEPDCGDGVVESPETCDDGNTVPGDGCDATCQAEIVAAGCPPVPDATCQPPPLEGSKLKLHRGRNLAESRMRWKWKSVPAEGTDLGDPRFDAGYRLCLYDETAGTPRLVLEAEAPAGPLWSATSRGLRFKGPTVLGQLTRLRLRSGSELKLTAKGRNLPALPLSQDDAVVVQLHNDTGSCWGERYTAPASRNDARNFIDR